MPKILIVEDNDFDFKTLERALLKKIKSGLVIEHAKNAQEAMQKAKEDHDLVICDGAFPPREGDLAQNRIGIDFFEFYRGNLEIKNPFYLYTSDPKWVREAKERYKPNDLNGAFVKDDAKQLADLIDAVAEHFTSQNAAPTPAPVKPTRKK